MISIANPFPKNSLSANWFSSWRARGPECAKKFVALYPEMSRHMLSTLERGEVEACEKFLELFAAREHVGYCAHI